MRRKTIPIHLIHLIHPVLLAVLLFLVLQGLVFGGQSLSNASSSVANYSVPQLTKSNPVRAEMYFHDWPSNPASQSGFPCLTHAAGFYCQFTSNNYLNIQSYWSQENRVFQIPLAGFPSLRIYIRWMHDPAGGTETVEAWDEYGARRYYSTQTITLNSDVDGGVLAGGASTGVGFFRIHTTLVAVNSRPPVTADNSNVYLHWKFDSSLTDSAPGALYPASGSPTYMNTPSQVVIAKAKTYSAPAWADWVSLRAGQWNQLDGSSSYSQSDSTSAVTYSWTQTSGAYQVQWDSTYNQSHATPKFRGTVFGTYTFRLTVSDEVSNGYTDLSVGAVATDSNGVVVQADPNADKIFGPMIAYGRNPWGYMDERQYKMIGLQTSYLSGWTDPIWTHSGAGTVSYPFSGKGMWYGGASGTTLTASVGTSDSATFPVAEASVLSLTSLPTWIIVGNISSGMEPVRICSTTATSGPATLTPCYNGRALSMTPDGQLQFTTSYSTPHSWPSGTVVGELRIHGTGTQFSSDSTVPICPAGVPGPSGPVTYSTGTVTLTGGSSTITGSGTTWSGSVFQNNQIRIPATHANGSAFIFWATITSVTDSTHLIVDRPVPTDIDSGSWSYKITSHRMIALHFTDPYGSDQSLRYGTLGCESETAMFAIPYYDVASLNGSTQTGRHYTYKPYTGDATAFGPNFYGTGLGARAFYYRSGYSPANTLANTLDDKWTKSPEVASGYAGGFPLLQGGGAIGAMANVLLNPSAQIGWPDIRHWFEVGNIGSWGCNDDDTRDTGYYGYWTVFGSMFDPNPGYKGGWQTNLNQIYTRENTCKSPNRTGQAVEVNSWAESGYRWAGNYGNNVVSLTNGQASGTGSGIDSSTCYGVAQGSGATLTNNSSTMTGTGFVTGSKIWLHGTKSGQSIYRVMRFTRNSSTSITLIGLWDGDTSSSISWTIDNSDWILAFGQNANSSSLIKNYSCVWNSASSITLDRPWESPTGTYYKYGYVLAGHGTQPYMLGIKTTEFNLARQSPDSTTAANFSALANLAAGWIHDYGYNATTGGLYYGRVFGACEPPITPATVSQMGVYVTPGCNSDGGISGSRVLIGEVSSSLTSYYLANSGLGDSVSWGDQLYGALWGYTPWNTGGVYSDQYSIGNVGGFNTTDTDLGSYKWPGFFFGMGMAHQWPAVRLGGLLPASPVTGVLSHSLGSVPGATSAVISLTAPSGLVTETTCSVTPATCQFSVDSRQGDYWYQIIYRNGSSTISQGTLTFLPLESVSTVAGAGRTAGGHISVSGQVR